MRPVGVTYSAAYTTDLSRSVFSTILAAAQDSSFVFGDSQASASELVLWAHGETEFCSQLLHQFVLASAAAAGGLRLSAECVQIAVSHCSLLEDYGLAMVPVLLRCVRPSVERALDANVKRIDDSVTAMASADDWSLQPVPLHPKSPATRVSAGMPLAAFKLSSSAYRLYAMVQVKGSPGEDMVCQCLNQVFFY